MSLLYELQIQLFPWEAFIFASEMAVCGGLSVNGLSESESLDDSGGSEIKAPDQHRFNL